MQRRETPLVELLFWLVLPPGYALLALVVARWLAAPLRLPPLAVVALPLAISPILGAFGKHWRNSWILAVPVAAAVLVVAFTDKPRLVWFTGLAWFVFLAAGAAMRREG